MKRVILERHESGDHGTFGRLIVDDLVFFTGELPWRENRANESCIPLGLYHCRWTYSNRFRRRMYEVVPVDGRKGIRIHSANLVGDEAKKFKKQLNGCVALGKKLGWMNKQKAVFLSVTAIREFETHMGKEPFELEVRNGLA